MQRFYRIADPLGLSWRRFMALLTNLPGDSAFMSRLRVEQQEAEQVMPTNILDEMERRSGRAPATETRQRSLDDLMGGSYGH